MYRFLEFFKYFFESGIFYYTVFVFLFNILLAVISAMTMVTYMRKNSFVDYSVLLQSPLAPSVALIAPAFNEGMTIVDNIHSLMSIHYNNFDVIIVNDGSKDDTLEKVINEFDLEKVNYLYDEAIPTAPVRGIYKSKNKAYAKLIFIDKANGGKSDSINAALNITTKKYFVAIDVDCVIEDDALLKMVKPFLEEHGAEKVIATGGVIRVANSCKIENGRILEVNVPRNMLARTQVLEYTRSFLMGRMAWSRLNGLLIISGAFGMFDREIAVKCGGYSTRTVGEDMELVIRMRRYMRDLNQKFKIVYIPDPLCWTEVPVKLKVLGRQRNRWTRGNIGTLLMHRKLFFNPKYGLMGTLSYPYWFFFEWMTPIIETIGIFYFIMIALLSAPNWFFFLLLLGFVYFFAVSFSVWSILFEEFSYHRYNKKSDMGKMIVAAVLEPLYYHPLTVYFSLRGNYHFLIGKGGWGNMERRGFHSPG